MQDVMLYVHVPFCSSKCHFCSWVSPIPTAELVRAKPKFGIYTTAVIEEIRRTATRLSGKVRPKLVYFGGGTPSLLGADELTAILSELYKQFPIDESFLDTTIEMSPDTATPEKLLALRQGGFSRISFGVQSFNERRAKAIGRAHSPATAIHAFDLARKAGFDNINVDLMIGFPEESEAEYNETVETALSLDPDHLSIYVYKKIPGTVMARLIDTGKLTPCTQPLALERYHRTSERLLQAGYSEYMFQLFQKREKRCYVDYHYFNLSYDYVGFGQGAHSLIAGKSYAHSQSLEEYLRMPGHNQSVSAGDSDTLLETKLFEMMHTDDGIDFAKFSNRLRISFDEAMTRSAVLRRAMDSVLATKSAEKTAAGVRIAERDDRVKWLALPPYWDAGYTMSANTDLVSISAAAAN